MVTPLTTKLAVLPDVRRAIAEVPDPEVPVVSIEDLGILRDVLVDEQASHVLVTITPTYSGCPAMEVIETGIRHAAAKAGFTCDIRTVLSPAWTTDWMTEDGRRKLREYGIAPPARAAGRRALFGTDEVACPRCGSERTELIAEFGSTSCKALWRCLACREPFDYFKCH